MAIEDVIVVDNVIDIKQQELLETIFTNPKLNWGYVKETVDYNWSPDIVDTDKSINSFQFVHRVFMRQEGQVSPTLQYFKPLIDSFPIELGELLQLKVNITTLNSNTTSNSYGAPHTDFTPPPDNLLTAIYYINDSDGDTFIFNEVHGSKTLTIKQRISPKRGRLVLFNGSYYHAGNYPSNDQPRITANINYFKK